MFKIWNLRLLNFDPFSLHIIGTCWNESNRSFALESSKRNTESILIISSRNSYDIFWYMETNDIWV